MLGRFDELCPHCEAKLNMQSVFESRDYSTDFMFECPACGKMIQCYVHTVPEFELSKFVNLYC